MIKLKNINLFTDEYGISAVEQSVVKRFVEKYNIPLQESLHSYFDSDIFIGKQILEVENFETLENFLEVLIPQDDRKLNGAFFTPRYVVDFIINEIQPKENETNLDPSCGCGAFLIGLVKYYKQTFNKPIKETVRENIFGSDILEYNIRRAKLLLTIYALQNGESLQEDDFNLWHQDSLQTDWQMQFDNIVGNPPYVKFQDLSDESRKSLAKNWQTVENGTFNLYFAFFELGYKLLKPKGKLGYITPNNYFTSLAGESLRRYFQNKKCVTRIVDFSHRKVFDAQTYTAITFLDKQQNEEITYDRIKDKQLPESFLANANGSANCLKNLNVKKWRLLKSDEQENIRIIENVGTPIGKLFDICVGIATLKDEVFFVDGNNLKNNYYVKTSEHGTFKIEKEITKPVYKISDFKNQDEVSQNLRRIICPYSIKNGNAIPLTENELSEKFPKCYEYLLSEKEKLATRDKGKVIYEPFFAWGRTQGITKFGKKILTPTFSKFPRFLFVEEETSYFTNGYGIYFKQDESPLFSSFSNPLMSIGNIDVVQKILNSDVMHYYISKTSVAIEGGYPCYQKNFIEKFTIPEFNENEIMELREIKSSEEISYFLNQKYGLNIRAD
jgi:adenine-specific DNA-methyltransferase